MLYTGTFELAIDPKNRLSIPAGIRREMDPEQDGKGFYLVPGDWRGTLNLYADNYFREFSRQRNATLEPGDEMEVFDAVFFGQATPLDIDKQGRVALPQWMLDLAKVGRQVMLSGARDHLILWDRAEYLRFMEDNGNRYKDLLRQARARTQHLRQNGNGHG